MKHNNTEEYWTKEKSTVEEIRKKKEKGPRNQANEPNVTSRSSFVIGAYGLYKSFDEKWRSWVGGIRQTRLPEEQVTSRSSGFKIQQGLRIPGPAPISFTITIISLSVSFMIKQSLLCNVFNHAS